MMNEIFKQYEKSIDRHGLITPNFKNESSENGARYTLEAVFALMKKRALGEWEKNHFRVIFKSLEIRPGLAVRIPHDMTARIDSIDNTLALIVADFILNTGFSKRFLTRGRETIYNDYDKTETDEKLLKWSRIIYKWIGPLKFTYNSRHPGKFNLRGFMGRFPQLIAAAKLVKGEKTSGLERAFFALSIVLGVRDRHTDSKILSGFLVYVFEKRFWYLDLIIKYWRKVFRKKYPHGAGQVLGNYYSKAHPNAINLQDYFFDTI